jgi:hypothetical protein
MGLAEGDQDTVGSGDETPEEEYDDKGAQCTVVCRDGRRLLGMVHEQLALDRWFCRMKIVKNSLAEK